MAAGELVCRVKDGRVTKLGTIDAAKYLGRGQTWMRAFRTAEKRTGAYTGPKYHVIDGTVWYYKKDLDEWLAVNPQKRLHKQRVKAEARVESGAVMSVSTRISGDTFNDSPNFADPNTSLIYASLLGVGFEALKIKKVETTLPDSKANPVTTYEIEAIRYTEKND